MEVAQSAGKRSEQTHSVKSPSQRHGAVSTSIVHVYWSACRPAIETSVRSRRPKPTASSRRCRGALSGNSRADRSVNIGARRGSSGFSFSTRLAATTGLLSAAQAHAVTEATLFPKKEHAGCLKRGLHFHDRGEMSVNHLAGGLKPLDGNDRKAGGFGQLALIPPEQRSAGSDLDQRSKPTGDSGFRAICARW